MGAREIGAGGAGPHACCGSCDVPRAVLVPGVYLLCTWALSPVLSRAPRGSGEDGGAAAWLRPFTEKPAAIAVRAQRRGGRQARQACRAWAPCPVNPCSRCAGRRRGCPPGRRARLDRDREDVAMCPGRVRWPCAGRCLAAGDGLGCVPGAGTGGRSAERADRLAGFANLRPFRSAC